MSQIKLLHSGGNGVSIVAPDSNPASDRTLKLPSDVNSTIDTLNRTGNILQVVSGTKSDTVSSNSTSYYSIGLNATITPSSTSSKILVLLDLAYGGNQNMYGIGKIVRTPSGGSATDIALGDDRTGSFSNSQRVSFSMGTNNLANVVYKVYHATVNFLDSPNTTAATTYAVKCKSIYGGGDGYFYINRPSTPDNQPYQIGASSNLTLMEIAA
jgi:hypothetical protein